VTEVPIGAFAGIAGPDGPPAMTPDGFSTDGPGVAPPLLDGALLELLFGPASDLPPS